MTVTSQPWVVTLQWRGDQPTNHTEVEQQVIGERRLQPAVYCSVGSAVPACNLVHVSYFGHTHFRQ